MTVGDILVLAVLGLTVGLILGKLHRDRKKGPCCGHCKDCPGCIDHSKM